MVQGLPKGFVLEILFNLKFKKMKNLESYGVLEINKKELNIIEGGFWEEVGYRVGFTVGLLLGLAVQTAKVGTKML